MATGDRNPSLFDLGVAAAKLRDVQRRQAIDLEAARRGIQAQIATQAAATGLLQKAMEIGNASPEMTRGYEDQYRQTVQGERQKMQNFLLDPANLPAPPKRGVGGFLQALVTPPVPQELSEAQKGLLQNTLAGQPVPLNTEAGTAAGFDFRPPEAQQKSRLLGSQIEENRGRAKYWGGGGGTTGGLIAIDPEGNERPYNRGEPLAPGERVVRPATERDPRTLGTAIQVERGNYIAAHYGHIMDAGEKKAAIDADENIKALDEEYKQLVKGRRGGQKGKTALGVQGGGDTATTALLPSGDLIAWARANRDKAWPTLRDEAIQRGASPRDIDTLKKSFAADDINGMETTLSGLPGNMAGTVSMTPSTTPPVAAAQPTGVPAPVQIPGLEAKLAAPATKGIFRTATNPQTGEKLGWNGTQWIKLSQ